MLLQRLFGRDALQDEARRLHMAATARGRSPAFYIDYGVPDTLDGRFEMIALHGHLIMRRLRAETGEAKEAATSLAQALFDVMFDDMDRALREMGVGDLGVGRRVKTMARAFYGRAVAYDHGLDDPDGTVLGEALRRNLYGTASPTAEHVDRMARYVRACDRELARIEIGELRRRAEPFASVPVEAPAGMQAEGG